jgi:cytosine/adenosine deaminase-related metal-dependent hydrolase
MSVRVFHADHVLPGDAPPIADGAVVVAGPGHDVAEGTILDVGLASDMLARHHAPSSLGGAARERAVEVVRVRGVVLPGLVNAHTHLELSAMRGKVGGGRGFVGWVDSLISQRPEIAPEEDAEAIDAAVDELVRTGTVAVGEVTNSLAAVRPLARRGIAGCVFHEVFGQDRAAVLRRVEALRAELDARLPSWPSRDLTYAPAPHTLYTTHVDAVRALLESATKYGTRTSLHLAEHAPERRAIEHGDGPVPEWLLARAKQSPVWPRSPLFAYADSLGALSPSVLLVHLTEARAEELAIVVEKGAPVVLCPRSNLHIEMKLPPLLAVRAAGLEAGLGTDSLASNASLDVLAEAKALADRFPSVPAWELVKMATWNGARALDRNDLGRLAKGARPGVLAVEGDVAAYLAAHSASGAKDGASFLLANLRLPRRMLAPRASENRT